MIEFEVVVDVNLVNRKRRKMIDVYLVDSLDLIVDTSACKDFKRRNVKSYQLSDASQSKEENMWTQYLRVPESRD